MTGMGDGPRGGPCHRVSEIPLNAGEDHAHGLLERPIGQQAARSGNLGGRLFSVGGGAAFTSRSKIAGPVGPPLALRPFAVLQVQVRSAHRLRRHEGRDGRGRSDERTPQ